MSPPGMFYNILFVSKDFKKQPGRQLQKVAEPCAYCLHLTMAWKPVVTDHISKAELEAMSSMNAPVFAAKAHLDMWIERKKFSTEQFPASATPE